MLSTNNFGKDLMMLRLFLLVLLIPLPVFAEEGENFSPTGKAFEKPQYLPVDEAFRLTASKQNESIRLHWLVKPGYYLYRDHLIFPGIKKMPELPSGKQKFDEIFGDVEVYYDELIVNVQDYGRYQQNRHKINIIYQGCAEAGLCYPPQKREIDLKTMQVKPIKEKK
tara:strand:- start:6221 stop:6721 length:501 start_codon:yes stop_codon:yes gene_type:complete